MLSGRCVLDAVPVRQTEESRQPTYQREPKWKRIPPVTEVIDQLKRREYLPAIWFIFSRAGCDSSAKQAYAAGVRLTTEEEQASISALVENLRWADKLAGPA